MPKLVIVLRNALELIKNGPRIEFAKISMLGLVAFLSRREERQRDAISMAREKNGKVVVPSHDRALKSVDGLRQLEMLR